MTVYIQPTVSNQTAKFSAPFQKPQCNQNEGGFGLVHIATKLKSFHLTLQSFVCKQYTNTLMAVIFQKLLDMEGLNKNFVLIQSKMVRSSLCISKNLVETNDTV